MLSDISVPGTLLEFTDLAAKTIDKKISFARVYTPLSNANHKQGKWNGDSQLIINAKKKNKGKQGILGSCNFR